MVKQEQMALAEAEEVLAGVEDQFLQAQVGLAQ
jgi:hypothetical protein